MKIWETFLRIEQPSRTDLAPPVDESWMAAKGIYADAPAVLRAVRRDVLPLVRRLEYDRVLAWYAFLVHDGTSGVPTTPDDKSLYVHLRLSTSPLVHFTLEALKIDLAPAISSPWTMTRETDLSLEIAGVDTNAINVANAWELLGMQSKWVLDLVQRHAADTDELTLLKHVRQFLHFFANMTQVRIA